MLVGIKHADGLRNILQGRVKLLLLTADQFFRLDLVRHVLVRGNPAAIGRRLIHHVNDAAIRQLHSDVPIFFVACCLSYLRLIFQWITHETTVLLAMLQHFKQCAAGLHNVSG